MIEQPVTGAADQSVLASASLVKDPPIFARHAVSSAIPPAQISANLDLLRAIAVLCVLVSHIASALSFRDLGSLGRFGVILFFIHTSFVLMASLDRMRKLSSGWRLVGGFWIRRIFRIYPLSIVFVILTVLLHVPPEPGSIYQWNGLKAFVSNLALTQNLTYSRDILGTLWSLPLEVQMYVLLPFVYFLLHRYSGSSFALWAVSIPIAIFQPRISNRLNICMYAPCFLSGVVAFDLMHKVKIRRLPACLWPVGLFAAVAIFGPLDDISLGHKIFRAWLLSLGVALLYVNTRESRITWIQHVFHWVAEQSYGIYLSHLVLLWLTFDVLHLRWEALPFLVASLFIVPALTYRYIEHPLTLLGAHISRRVLHKQATSFVADQVAKPVPLEHRADV